MTWHRSSLCFAPIRSTTIRSASVGDPHPRTQPPAWRQQLEVWSAGLQGGLLSLARDPTVGLRRLIFPVSYWRTPEFAYVRRELRLPNGASVLDLGSAKELGTWLALRRGYAVTSADILTAEVSRTERYASALGIRGSSPGHLRAEVQDGRSLTFANDAFDAAYCVSTLGNIPGDGDSQTIRELLRVVRVGGVVVVTVPFGSKYSETYVNRPVHERDFEGQPIFWERRYDRQSMVDRLQNLPGARLVSLEFWGERVRLERWITGRGPLRFVLLPLEPLLALLALRPLADSDRATVAFFTLQKTS